MRNLLIAGLAVASLTGIAYAQTERADSAERRQQEDAVRQGFREVNNVPRTCVDAAGVTRNLNQTTTIGNLEFRCVQTFGDRLRPKGADWVLVPAGRWIQSLTL